MLANEWHEQITPLTDYRYWGGLDLREKLHRRAVDECDVLEIEGDATVGVFPINVST